MRLDTFLDLLKSNPSKQLRFSYSPEQFVNADYHITEVKHVLIETVDCGAQQHQWRETVIQLLEADTMDLPITTSEMTCFKALGILNKVGKLKPFTMNSEVKFEYGNPSFHTAQLTIGEVSYSENSIIVHLGSTATDCKAKDICGIEAPKEEPQAMCCEPSSNCC
ncbi:DUF6428 family protein [Winogradskyella maritima]|uniref:DUF6428 family protein n=1 Tax=Winogradskyella maritima TaxID=1517766 RepID=A0ABV8AI98_9FLAO|nr:DUF6428 family protein [Winogradskyella maritima]